MFSKRESRAGQGGERSPSIYRSSVTRPATRCGVQRCHVGLALPWLGPASGTRACVRCLPWGLVLNKEKSHAHHCLVTRSADQRHHPLDVVRRFLNPGGTACFAHCLFLPSPPGWRPGFIGTTPAGAARLWPRSGPLRRGAGALACQATRSETRPRPDGPGLFIGHPALQAGGYSTFDTGPKQALSEAFSQTSILSRCGLNWMKRVLCSPGPSSSAPEQSFLSFCRTTVSTIL